MNVAATPTEPHRARTGGLTPAQLVKLSCAAVAAPSADNLHVFNVCFDGGRIQLVPTLDFRRTSMLRRILGLVSLGAAAENIVLRGQSLGLRIEPRWRLPDGGDAALVEFSSAGHEAACDPLERMIGLRHSNRTLFFKGPPLQDDERRQLDAAAAVPGSAIAWFDSPGERRQALKLLRWAETARFNDPKLHREAFSALRFDLGWEVAPSIGLPLGAMGALCVERPLYKVLRHWPRQSWLNRFGMHHISGWRNAALPCMLSPHVGAIGARGDLDAAAVTAGRCMQRTWLQATALGLSFQVFAAAPLYMQDEVVCVPPALRDRLVEGWSALWKGSRPFLMFRLGRAAAPRLRTARPDLAQMLGPS